MGIMHATPYSRWFADRNHFYISAGIFLFRFLLERETFLAGQERPNVTGLIDRHFFHASVSKPEFKGVQPARVTATIYAPARVYTYTGDGGGRRRGRTAETE